MDTNNREDRIKYYIDKAIQCLIEEIEMNKINKYKTFTSEDINEGAKKIKDSLTEGYNKGFLDSDFVIDKGLIIEEIIKKYNRQKIRKNK